MAELNLQPAFFFLQIIFEWAVNTHTHTPCFPAGGWQPSTSVPVCLERGKGLRLPASPPPDMAVATALHFPSHLHVAHSVHPFFLTKTSHSVFTQRSMLFFSLTLVLSLHADVSIQLTKLSFALYPTAESSAGQTAKQTALEKHPHATGHSSVQQMQPENLPAGHYKGMAKNISK